MKTDVGTTILDLFDVQLGDADANPILMDVIDGSIMVITAPRTIHISTTGDDTTGDGSEASQSCLFSFTPANHHGIRLLA